MLPMAPQWPLTRVETDSHDEVSGATLPQAATAVSGASGPGACRHWPGAAATAGATPTLCAGLAGCRGACGRRRTARPFDTWAAVRRPPALPPSPRLQAQRHHGLFSVTSRPPIAGIDQPVKHSPCARLPTVIAQCGRGPHNKPRPVRTQQWPG